METKEFEEYTIEDLYRLYEDCSCWFYKPIFICRDGKIELDYEQ